MIKFVKEFKNKSTVNSNELSGEAVSGPAEVTEATAPTATSLTTSSSTHQTASTLKANEEETTNNLSSFHTLSTDLRQMQEVLEKQDDDDSTTLNISLSEPFSQSTIIEQQPNTETQKSITRKGTLNEQKILFNCFN